METQKTPDGSCGVRVGTYRLGAFDGRIFTPETNTIQAELGPNGYAAQTWSDVPASDGRRIQISWMWKGLYPGMPFNQQMSFPLELSLRTTREGIRLFRKPVQELATLHTREHSWRDHMLASGNDRLAVFYRFGPTFQEKLPQAVANIVVDTEWDLFDIRADIEFVDATSFGSIIHGNHLRYEVAERKFTYLDQEIPAEPDKSGRLSFQLLVDRTSLELFVDGGRASASFCFLPAPHDVPLEFYAREGSVRIVSLTVHELASIWR